ncbi:1-aminocyclopropane-1-carboxylate oxidase homolog 12 [Daucus carota subsp. sativus]
MCNLNSDQKSSMAATTTATHSTDFQEQRMKSIKDFDETKAGVKGLSDSGITTIPSFFIHPAENLAKSSSKSTLSIPVIDLSQLHSDDHKPKIVEQIHQAAKTWGFFQVINHGSPVSVLEETITAVKTFHEQRSEVKAKFYRREEGRGVMYASNNDLYRSKAASWHDSLQVWMAPEATPENEIPEACRREVVQWDMHAKKVGEAVLELLGLGLGLESGKFKDLDFCGTRVFVGHIYPYCPQPDLTMGITSHTDPTMITVLLQNQIQGLQVKHGEEWVDVKPLHGGLIINIGDMLQIVSNGEYKSVEHRVLANSNRESRISIVMFMNLSNSAWKESAEGGKYYGPLPELLTPENPPVYRDFTLQEHLDSFYTKGLESKSLIDKITLIKRDN